jgi:hypothetical protein
MALTQLLGGPDWDVTINPSAALFADFHYFFNSGSVVRTEPWVSPAAPVAKVLNVTNITANPVALNYVSSSGELVARTLTSGSTEQITSQTIPLGLDNTAWLSASIVSDFTGSITARPTGSRFFELRAIRTISQQTNAYTIADGATTITKSTTGFPTSGSAVYRCSRTIPYLDQPFWLIRDLASCAGGTTTTTTTTTTTSTTTTTTLAPGCFIYNVTNNGAGSAYFDYKYCSGSYVHQELAGGGASMNVCVENHDISSSYGPMVITNTGTPCTSGSTTTTSTSTTTSTTSTSTTTTSTTTAASQTYYAESCDGPGSIVGIITILNAGDLSGKIVRLDSDIAGLSCFQIFYPSTGTNLGTRSVTNIYDDCVDCSD